MTRRKIARVAGLTFALAATAYMADAQTYSRERMIGDLLGALDDRYVFPAKATEMRRSIEARLSAGAYAKLNGEDLADALTTDLQTVSHDKHLRVTYPVSNEFERALASVSLENFGIGKPEILPGNIAYLELRSFGAPASQVRDAVAKAMTEVANASALIIDIRRNGGGSPDYVALVSSYLFGPEPIHLNSLYWRRENRTDDFYTSRSVDGKRFGPDKPVYILTSRRTFSAAEEFAYNLQSRRRAIIVGDTTGGGAHPGGVMRLDGGFLVFVPEGRAINPITKTNWEGTGVRPEIAVPSDSARDAALAAARKKIA